MRGRPVVNPSVRYKASNSPYDCWKLFVDNSILIPLKTHTIREATKNEPNFLLPMEKLEAFISLQYARGIYGKSHSVNFLWSEKYGPPIFRETMSRADIGKDILDLITKISEVRDCWPINLYTFVRLWKHWSLIAYESTGRIGV